MIKTVNYMLPTWCACPLINNDCSGISEEEEQTLDEWLASMSCEGETFYCVGVSEETHFTNIHGLFSGVSDCASFTFQTGICNEQEKEFITQALETLLWSETMTDEEGECLGNYRDNYNVSDIKKGFPEFVNDCVDFIEANQELLDSLPEGYSVSNDTRDMPYSMAGHDFILTRNGHGIGFWERGLGELGDNLTKASKNYGSCNLEINDDNTLIIIS